MNVEEFIEKNYFGLKIDCPRDITTIYQAMEDYAKEQLLQANVSCSLPSRKKMSSEIKKSIQKKEVMLRDGKNAYCIGFCDGVEYVKRHIEK